ncbi:SDR family NAD(P)-dependent oxidoreductase [Acanthopleuribacter pedis]|uniref:SDR family NAD(P)-dependent oxidoreductase n=1 Tax=Acanthopleuribacter pedis TaxID=442870 RepID=A0A8J7U619_9BACT|nr:SDR family NAD(P)-dependent oxidoreductase [Acanthopleuribacter pedis]MBO1323148.1 SDR family NAD(P)-dependent oxidoreductase [Acanthopleuribacter pedis]
MSPKTLLVTGATDGIGLKTAEMLLAKGCRVLIHGRNPEKLADVYNHLVALADEGRVLTYRADLSDLAEVAQLAERIRGDHKRLDAVIHNAGVFRTAQPETKGGLDVRFVVNTLAPFLLTERLLPLLPAGARIVNVSSAAQASVDLAAMRGERRLSDNSAYAQSKLALTVISFHQANQYAARGLVVVAVNPASFLGSKMVKEAYGMAGGDLRIGADILTRAALSDEFADASGRYYDNDHQRFAPAHADASDPNLRRAVVETAATLTGLTQ